MIELRWLESLAPAHFYGTDVYSKERVLQWRQMQNPEEIGIQEPIWTDWDLIPTVLNK